MPISASAKKSLRVAQRQAKENKIVKLRVKKQLKMATAETLGMAYSLLDKSAKNHVMHKNKAARLKSRLAKRLSQPVTPLAKPKVAAQAKKA